MKKLLFTAAMAIGILAVTQVGHSQNTYTDLQAKTIAALKDTTPSKDSMPDTTKPQMMTFHK